MRLAAAALFVLFGRVFCALGQEADSGIDVHAH